MRKLILALAFLWASCAFANPPNYFTQPNIQTIGGGCTTAFYVDTSCGPCGVGMYSSGVYNYVTSPVVPSTPVGYQVVQTPPSPPSSPFYSVGDVAPADPADPNDCTTTQWEAKSWTYNGTSYSWNGAAGNGTLENDAMLGFLCQVKGWCPASPTVYYLSQSGSDTTGTPNDPTHPYLTASKILNLNKTAGYPGDVAVIVRGGKWGATWSTTWLDFTPADSYDSVTNPDFNISGTSGHPDYIMNFPGEVVETDHGFYQAVGVQPQKNYGWITWDGIKFWDPTYGNGNSNGDALFFTNDTDVSVINCEFAGWDKIAFGVESVNTLLEHNVFHEMASHAIYFLFSQQLTGSQWTGTGTTSTSTPNTITVSATAAGTLLVNDYPLDQGNCIPVGAQVTAVSITGGTGNFTISGTGVTCNSAGEKLASMDCIGVYLTEMTPAGDFDFAKDAANYAAGTSCGASYGAHIIENVFYSNGNSGLEPIHVNTRMYGLVAVRNIVSYSGGAGFAMQTGNYGGLVTDNLIFDNAQECLLIYTYGVQSQGSNFNQASSTSRWNTITNNFCWAGLNTDSIRGQNPTAGIVLNDGTGLRYVKDTTANGNIITTASATIGQTALHFEQNSYPENTTADNNQMWYTNGTACQAGVDSGASPTVPAGTYNLSNWGSINPAWSGNTCVNPSTNNPGWNVSESLITTPGQFNFGIYNLR